MSYFFDLSHVTTQDRRPLRGFGGLVLSSLIVTLGGGCQGNSDSPQGMKEEAETETSKQPSSGKSGSDKKPGEDQPSGKSGKDSGDDGFPKDDNNGAGDPGDDDDDDIPDDGPKFDVGVPVDCEGDLHRACDKDSDDPLHAFGINCPGEKPQMEAKFDGHESSYGVRRGLGNTSTFNPKEGKKSLILGTGKIEEIDKETPAGDRDYGPTYCSDYLSTKWELKDKLPPPMRANRVGAVDCSKNPALVGTGDCSNTIQAQWDAAKGSKARGNDYAELRLKVTVPEWAKSLSYDFAFFTTEYPAYYGKRYNDMFIAWLESKKWTGNVSFDEMGNPISLNAGFLNFKDAEKGTLNDPDCLGGCSAPELHGSCMKQHAGTKWLRTKLGVTPGEEIELIFAMIDLGDPILDSFVLLDNFRWHCDEQEKPETDPPK